MPVKEMSRFKKYLMIITMIGIAFSLVFWIFKKAMQQREEYLRQVALENEKRHAKIAIMEEQEDKHIKEENTSLDMRNDTKTYNNYLEFSPLNLWDRYLIKKDLEKIPPTTSPTNDTPASVEVLMYYQSFVKAFRVIVVTIKDLKCFKTNDSYMLRAKILLSRSNGDKQCESSQMYPIANSIDMEEKFSFRMEEQDFLGCILYITVWSIDVFYKELLLGAISIDLSLYDHTLKKTLIEDLLPVKQDKNVYGHVLVSLCHVPSVERLVCVLMSGRGLKETIKNTSVLSKAINPYFNVSLLNTGKLIKDHKTEISIETRDPVFNEMIEFYVPESQVSTSDIRIIVSYRDDKNFNETIGKVMVGNHSSGKGSRHWKEVIENPNNSVAFWHPVIR